MVNISKRTRGPLTKIPFSSYHRDGKFARGSLTAKCPARRASDASCRGLSHHHHAFFFTECYTIFNDFLHSLAAQQAKHHAMIYRRHTLRVKILLHVCPDCSIPHTDGIPQIIAEHLLDCCWVSRRERRAETVDPCCIRPCCSPEPILHQFIEQFTELAIGNPQSEYVRIGLIHMLPCQITCSIQDTPHIFSAVLNISVGQLLTDPFRDFPAI